MNPYHWRDEPELYDAWEEGFAEGEEESQASYDNGYEEGYRECRREDDLDGYVWVPDEIQFANAIKNYYDRYPNDDWLQRELNYIGYELRTLG